MLFSAIFTLAQVVVQSRRGKGRTPPSRAAGAAKTPSGGSRGKTSPTKPTTAPARGAVRGAGRITAGKTTGVYCYLVGHCRFVD